MAALNAKTLNKILSGATVTVSCDELGDVKLRRLNAYEKINFGKRFNASAKTKDGNFKREEDAIEFFIWLISVAVVDDKGEAFLSSDEGRAIIGAFQLDTLQVIGTAALELQQGGGKKKTVNKSSGTSTTTTTDSSSNSPKT